MFTLHSDLPFLTERKKIKKFSKLVRNIHGKETKTSQQALNHGLILKKVYRVIQFNQKAPLKPYIDMYTKL